jgi:hypothetical protein
VSACSETQRNAVELTVFIIHRVTDRIGIFRIDLRVGLELKTMGVEMMGVTMMVM